jgi:hypothetical protein
MAYRAIQQGMLPLPDDIAGIVLTCLGPPKKWTENSKKEICRSFKEARDRYPTTRARRVKIKIRMYNKEWGWSCIYYTQERLHKKMLEELTGVPFPPGSRRENVRWWIMMYGLTENIRYRFCGKHVKSYLDN